MSFKSDVQKLEINGAIRLFELDATKYGGPIFRFHGIIGWSDFDIVHSFGSDDPSAMSKVRDNLSIIWQGEEEFDTFTGRVYLDKDASELVSSKQNVRFPFTPKSFYIDVRRIPIEKEVAEKRNLHYIEGHNECYYSVIKNPEQLHQVWEYYDKK